MDPVKKILTRKVWRKCSACKGTGHSYITRPGCPGCGGDGIRYANEEDDD